MCIKNHSITGMDRTVSWRSSVVLGLLLSLCAIAPWSWAAAPGVTNDTLRIGATLPLEGDFKVYGQAMKRGMEAALAGQSVQKHRIEFVAINDFYHPPETIKAVQQLIEQGVFAMVNSFGSPTTKAVLPLLAEHKVPVFGFYTGAAFTGPGDVLNFRASYATEVERVVEAALAAGVKPAEVCAYAQNDAYGMAGVQGVRNALAKQPGAEEIVAKIDQVLNMPGDNPERNNIGPVGVYARDTVSARPGYLSLKKWEASTGNHCRLVATTAVYDPAATFIGYAASLKGENWIFSSPSPAAGEPLAILLREYKIRNRVITTQIVPALDAPLPVVEEARQALGGNLDYTSLESYIVGKLFVAILQAIDGPLTRENFLKAARRHPYDIGGIRVDFTNDNQGSDFVLLTVLQDDAFKVIEPSDVEKLLSR
ncbi:MAG: ABC transporter substrate-binding protein [Candidatus Competibacteraceae bacterium]|nr:ABC transporter substrate-binding protein [Candidatus Competibacteraceae bacterium]